MRAPKILASLTCALLIVGAGCESAPTDTNTNSGSLVLPSESSSDVNAPAMTTDTNKPAAADDSMKTYSNAALGYSFQWPATGRYAPMWDTSVASKGDARFKDSCFVAADGKTDSLTAGGATFCHTAVDAKDGASATDYYVTEKSGQYVVLTFTKKKDAFKDFSWTDYRAGLAKIVGSYSTSK